MSKFWPEGVVISDTQSPMEILESAQEDWKTNSDGVLELDFQKGESDSDGNSIIRVYARHIPSNRTASLFTVLHRPNAPYPARILPKDDKLPNAFKKKYYQPGFLDYADVGAIASHTGRYVENTWVCDTPSEFRAKLEEVFNLGTLKYEIMNLVSNRAPDANEENEEPTNGQGGANDDKEYSP